MAKDAYGRIARFYDRVVEPVLSDARRIGLTLWPPWEGMRVLDIGCGTGAQLQLYEKAKCDVTGVDPSPAMLRIARQRLGETAPLEMREAEQWPSSADRFDLVLLSMVLHELEDEQRTAVLNTAKRAVKPEGRILVLEYHPGPLSFPQGWLTQPVILLVERLAGAAHYRNQRSFIKLGGVASLASRNQLQVEQSRIIKGGNFGVFLLKPESLKWGAASIQCEDSKKNRSVRD